MTVTNLWLLKFILVKSVYLSLLHQVGTLLKQLCFMIYNGEVYFLFLISLLIIVWIYVTVGLVFLLIFN